MVFTRPKDGAQFVDVTDALLAGFVDDPTQNYIGRIQGLIGMCRQHPRLTFSGIPPKFDRFFSLDKYYPCCNEQRQDNDRNTNGDYIGVIVPASVYTSAS